MAARRVGRAALRAGLSGAATRGKTAPNRLRPTDTYVALAERDALTRGSYVDIGYGWDATTTAETFGRLRRIVPDLFVVGVEIDAERVAAAQAQARDGMRFVHGGFELPTVADAGAGVVRAMNVLRQYDEDTWAPAVATLARVVAPGGLLLEGTSDPWGRHAVVNLLRRPGGSSDVAGGAAGDAALGGLVADEVLVAVRLATFVSPLELRAVLAKNLIHRAGPGGRLDAFFAAWHGAWERTRQAGLRLPAARWRAAAAELDTRGAETQAWSVAAPDRLARRGFAVVRGLT